MQPPGLAAEQRELMLQQWESDYKVLALRCRLNMGCGSKEDAPNTGRTSAAAPESRMRNDVGDKWIILKFPYCHRTMNSCFPVRFQDPEARDPDIFARYKSSVCVMCP